MTRIRKSRVNGNDGEGGGGEEEENEEKEEDYISYELIHACFITTSEISSHTL
jgi:hypothetical protein